jgi:hypothetical protein
MMLVHSFGEILGMIQLDEHAVFEIEIENRFVK